MAGGLKAAAASADENNFINITFNNLDDGDGLGRDSPHSPTGPNCPIATGLGRRGRRQDYSNFIKATAAEETGLAKASAEFDNFCAAGSLSCGGLNSLKYGPKGDLGSDAA